MFLSFPDSPGFIKICGLRTAEHAVVAGKSGAHALGFILAPSRRRVSTGDVARIRSDLVQLKRIPLTVGVMVNPTADEARRAVDESGIDLVQLSGDEEPGDFKGFPVPIIKAFRFAPGTQLDDARELIEPWMRCSGSGVVHIDTFSPIDFGGTGIPGDWAFAGELASEYPVILAGGLSPENVSTAIDVVRSCGVDVSTGVETGGQKDAGRIAAFIEAARHSFIAVSGGIGVDQP